MPRYNVTRLMVKRDILTLLLCVFHACFAEIVRFDRQSVWDKQLLQVDASVPGLQSNLSRMTVGGQGQFVVNYNCQVAGVLCDNFKIVVNRAIQKLSSVVFLNTNVLVNMIFRSFCPARNCGQTPLGQASPASYFPAMEQGSTSVYSYPQALVKQMNYNVPIQFSQYDIMAEFNSDYDFFYDLNVPKKPEQADMEGIVLHELLHGLGYSSGWTSWSETYNIQGANGFLAPLLVMSQLSNNQQIVSGFSPLFIFDRNVVQRATNTPMKVYADAISGFRGAGVALNTFVANFYRSGAPFQAAQTVFQTATSQDGVVFRFTDKRFPDLFLHTPSQYSGASSLSHNSQTRYQGTAEFLMTAEAYDVTVSSFKAVIANQVRAGNNLYGGLGVLTVQVLTEMGNDSRIHDK
jgi:hypothetical protein